MLGNRIDGGYRADRPLPIGETHVNDGLRAESLSVRRGTEVLFDALDFSLLPGQLTWLRGTNGSGKTSLLRAIAGLAQPDSGRLLWNGEPLNTPEVAESYRAQLLYLGHTNGLKDDLTPLESLQFLTTVHGRRHTAQQLQAALVRLGVAHRRRLAVRWLSQGQRRRVALARLALETTPGWWVLDEPFDALDDAGVARVQELMQENVQRGGAVLFTSHIPVALAGVTVNELQLCGRRSA